MNDQEEKAEAAARAWHWLGYWVCRVTAMVKAMGTDPESPADQWTQPSAMRRPSQWRAEVAMENIDPMQTRKNRPAANGERAACEAANVACCIASRLSRE